METTPTDATVTSSSTDINGEKGILSILNNKGSWPSWPAIYVVLDDSNMFARRLLNEEAEIAKGITRVNEGMTLSDHMTTTASAEKQKRGTGNVFKKRN